MQISSTSQKEKILFSRRLYSFIERNFAIVNIVFYQFFGTLFFGYGVVTGLNGNFAYNSFFSGLFSSVWIPLCFFMMICYAGRFTKAHLNPAVTFAFMIKKQDRLTFYKGLIYWAAQFTGAIGGTGIVNDTSSQGAPWVGVIPNSQYYFVLNAFRGQIFGTFLFVLFVMIISTPDTTPCQSFLQSSVLIPLTFLCARQYSYRLQGLNPAFAISFQLFFCIYHGNWGVWAYIWSTFVGPLIGSAIAALFFQYIYRRFLLFYVNQPKKISKRINLMQAELF